MQTSIKLLTTSLLLSLGTTLVSQTKVPARLKPVVPITKTTATNVINKDLLKAGQYCKETVGGKKNEITFTVEKEYSGKALSTRHLKKKTKEIDDFCAKDFFKTSGMVNEWKVFDEQGFKNSHLIVPGAIFDLSKFEAAFFKPVQDKKRNPIKITIADPSSSTVTKGKVENPKNIAAINENGVRPIKKSIKKNVAANSYTNINFERQYSSSQLDIAVGGSIPYIGGKIEFSTSTSSNNTSEINTYLIEYKQDYYTLLASGNSISNKNYFKDESLNNNSKWGYIESVTYGRRIVAVINSTYTMDEMINNAEVKASIGFGKANGSVKTNSKQENEIFTYSINIMGGNSGASNTNIASKAGNINQLINDINSIINDPKNNAKYATPVSFVLKDLEGDHVVSTYSPIETEVESCNPLYMVRLNNLEVLKVSDGVNKKNIELYGSFKVKAYDDNGKLFHSEAYLELRKKVGNNVPLIDAKTTFADKKNPIKKGEQESYAFGKSKVSGGNEWRIPNNALNGYFIIEVDAVDKDSGSKDDDIKGESLKIYFKNLTGFDEKKVKCNGDKNEVRFNFEITRVE